MSQEKLAAAAGINRKTLVEIELGKSVPHESTLEAIQTALEAEEILFIESPQGVGVMWRKPPRR